jgi:hypothetical protein
MVAPVCQPMFFDNMSVQAQTGSAKKRQAVNFFATYLVSLYPCTSTRLLRRIANTPIKFCKLLAAQQDISSMNNMHRLSCQAKPKVLLFVMW